MSSIVSPSSLDVTGQGQVHPADRTVRAGLGGRAKDLDLPFLRTVVIGEPGSADPYCYWRRISEIDEAGVLLVRPTGTSRGGSAPPSGTPSRPPPCSGTPSTRCSPPARSRSRRPPRCRNPRWSDPRPPATSHDKGFTLMTETRPFTSVWSDLAQTEFSQGFIDAGGYRTRYLHAGDTSQADPDPVARHHRARRGLCPEPEIPRGVLLGVGDRLHRPRLQLQAQPPAGGQALRRPGAEVHGRDRGGARLLLRGIPRRVDRRPLGDRPPGEGGPGRVEHHGRHHGQPEGDGTALHPVDGGGEGPVLGTGPGPAGVVDGRPDDGHRRPDQDPAGDLPAAGLVAGV